MICGIWIEGHGFISWSTTELNRLCTNFRCGRVWQVFHLSLCLITFWGRLVHLAYHVHKSDHKSSKHHFLLKIWYPLGTFEDYFLGFWHHGWLPTIHGTLSRLITVDHQKLSTNLRHSEGDDLQDILASWLCTDYLRAKRRRKVTDAHFVNDRTGNKCLCFPCFEVHGSQNKTKIYHLYGFVG